MLATMNGVSAHRRTTEDELLAARLYDSIDGPLSRVPIVELLASLEDAERSRFLRKFTHSIRVGRFDEAGLVFLFEGEWIPFDHKGAGAKAFLEDRIEALGFDIAQDVYVKTAGLALGTLRKWAHKHAVALPFWLTNKPDDVPVTAGEQAGASDDLRNSKESETPSDEKCRNLGGRPPNLDKGALFDEARRMIAAGEQASLDHRSHTRKRFVDALQKWAADHMECPYDYEYLNRLIKPLWRETRS